MIILYILLFLTLNFFIYKIVRKLNSAQFQIIFTFILIVILKLFGNIENETVSSLIRLSNFSVCIPFFSFCFTLMKNTKKKTNGALQLKIVYYLNKNNYVLHITIFTSFYQLFMLITKTA